MDKDLYEILGVTKTASETEIKKAFHKLAKKHHPDVNQNNKASEQKFKEINLAYEVLKDPKKRAHYDQVRAMGGDPFARGGQQGYGGQGAGAWGAAGGNPFGNESFQDFGLGDLFEEIFGGGGSRGFGRERTRRGQDQEMSMQISFIEAALGAEKSIQLSDGRRLTVKIPEGVETGTRIKLTGQGAQGVNTNVRGDLYIVFNVLNHSYFERSGKDILLKLPITFSEAVLGKEIEIPTLEKNLFLKIPAGISSGQKLKIPKKGVKVSKTGDRGDMVVEVLIKIPKPADNNYKEAAELANKSNFNPRADLI